MENKVNYDLKHLQKVQLSILKDVDRFCKENGIVYYMTMGTLLGSVRHGGFIPWDDDIDIDLLRDDYEKFIELFPKWSEKYFLQNYKTDKNYFNVNYSKVRLKGTEVVEKGTELIEQEKGICIDVFPVDVVPKNEKNRLSQRKKICFYSKLAMAKSGYKSPKNSILKNLCIGILSFLLKPVPLKYFGEKVDCLKKMYRNSDSNLIARTHYIKGGDKVVFDKSVYGTPIKLVFEDCEFNAPHKYIQFLESVYGDYKKLPPESERYNFNHCVEKVDFGEYK